MAEKSKIAKREEKTLAWWQENKIFEKSLAKPAPAGEFVFYDGPPFATGLPHYGHVLPGTIKDIIPRYRTMRGYHVPRRWGWDCHGLPVENLVEKELGLETKKEIEKFGIAEFNKRARASVLRYEKEWREIIPRTGRWVDMEHAYKTMDPDYIEMVWWSFKKLYENGLIYNGFKPMHLCPHCETTLSNFEVSQNYKDITDISVYVKFELLDEPGTFLLAWTTTPWTLPGNAALAVRPEGIYVKAKKDEQFFVCLKDLTPKVLKDNYEVVAEMSGKDLIGKKYKTLFDYYLLTGQVYAADFVGTEEGTGIVHIAPAFGEDDYGLSLREQLPLIQPVATDGRFKPEVRDFAGLPVKPKDDHQRTDILIIKYLAAKNLLFAKEKIVHSYPHCWRCDTPLLNYAASSWFVKVTDIKDQLIANNKKVHWVPEDIRDGRFGKWLEGARDWAISRSRFWGTPLPVWQCERCEKQTVIGSIVELKKMLFPSQNKYVVMRHGEADSNVRHILSGRPANGHHLTANGLEQVKATAEKLRAEKINLIIASDFLRTRETAELLQKEWALKADQVILDERLRELNFGDFDGQTVDVDYQGQSGVETFGRVKERLGELLKELETKYQNKNVLLVTHDLPARALAESERGFALAEYRELNLVSDLHRPYIDQLIFPCDCGGEMRRVPEVFDAWYDSGSVPFASTRRTELIPADFVAEGLDQTRGWFYTTLVLATALFGQAPYKQAVVSGLVLAADGRKMSKRLNNYPELTKVLDRYGADALRYYLVVSPLSRAEETAFSEKGLDEVVKKIILRLENVLSFYELYKKDNQNSENKTGGKNVLDQWILARLAQLHREVTDGLENYEFDRAARPIALFIDDLSTWYLRRSRKRPEALPVLRQVLAELAKIIAPFMPLIAEEIYQKVKDEKAPESVHLETWPEPRKFDEKILTEMSEVRKIIQLALNLRQTQGIPIRHPLAKIEIKPLREEFKELIREEVNVDEVRFDEKYGNDNPVLDFNLTHELQKRGEFRDLLRLIQDERKKMKLKPGELVELTLNPDKKYLVDKNEAELKRVCSLSKIKFDSQCLTISITPTV